MKEKKETLSKIRKKPPLRNEFHNLQKTQITTGITQSK